MRRILLLSLLGSLLLSIAAAQPLSSSAYVKIKADAEREYAEKSFLRAHELYERAAQLELAPADRRWVDFRLADTTLRADAASPDDDPTARNAARQSLEETIAKAPDDELRAQMNEALGDHYVTHPRENNRGAAQSWYVAALEYWAGSSDLQRARRRYLDIVWKLAGDNEGWNIPRNVLVNAVAIAQTHEERARARYLLAVQLAQQGGAADVERALELFQEVISIGRVSDQYDDALFQYASQLAMDRGHRGPNGEPLVDFKKAVAAYRRILAEFKPGETRYYNDARNAIASIVEPTLGVFAAGTFVPESEQEIQLVWRNTRRIELSLVSVDLTKDAGFIERGDWSRKVSAVGRPVVRKWVYETNDPGEHRPGQHALRLEPKLAPGAYVILASAEGKREQQLVLVSDAHVLVHAGHERMDVFVSDVESGEPISSARVHVWQRNGDAVIELNGLTNGSGLATFKTGNRSGEMLVTAAAGSRQAYHRTYSYYHRQTTPELWRVYAFTDRPAYRPREMVQWKILARIRDDERWITPDGRSLDYEITGPRGEKVSSGVAKLNAFGSFWGELALSDSMALGAYTIAFRSKGEHRGGAQLFRLEEYKLPEFMVKVTTPEGKQVRLGDTIEATVEASYYFGGPVANATAEVVIYQRPFFRYWYPRRHYDWYYPTQPDYYGNGTVIRRETIQTDAAGRAVVSIETPRDGNDMTYLIEARVVDASRREVRGEGSVRVMRQRYTVMAQAEHSLHRPGESVSVDFKAMDANDKPVQAKGTVTVVRRRWVERPVADPTLGSLSKRSGRPITRPSAYEDEVVSTTILDTDAKGEVTYRFTPKSVGYYLVKWTGSDGPQARDVITAETAVWVADRNTTELGYRLFGLELIVDRETLKAGETASIMVVTPASGRWVVFTTVADDILDTQVLKMDGTVKLVQFPIDDRHVPNFFVNASSVFERTMATDSERIVVPPVEQFLNVEVKSDREQYKPQEEGTVTVTTRDANGKAVRAEVALALSDEAVTAIQQDPAGDPRPFFYGETRQNPLQIGGSLQSQQYLFLKEETEAEERLKKEADGEWAVSGVGVLGGVVGGRARDAVSESITVSSPPPPPAPAMEAKAQRANAITVTAEAPAVMDQAAGAGIDVQVRTDFRSTAFWKPDLVTDANGSATVKVKFPDALTTWRATARAASATSQFGMSSSTARTNMPLLVRLQGPRFFVAGDRVVVSAVINNNTASEATVTPTLEVEGLTLEGASTPATVRVPAQGEARVDWNVVASKAGAAKLRVSARSATEGDAMERTFTVYEHGIDKLIARSGKLRGSEALVRLDLPRERRATELTVQVAPSIAVTMLDALPYLIQYPYGCTEQTMSRFLPAAIVARTLEKLKLGRARVAGKELDAVTAAGIARLYDMQHSDGGWGWWKEGNSDPFMTAYVVWGFSVARDGGLSVDAARVDRAVVWLNRKLVEFEKEPSDQAWMLHAMSAWRKGSPSNMEKAAFENIWKSRERLTAYSRALLALTAHRWNDIERAKVLIRNLEDGVKIDRAPDTSILLKGETTAETMATAHWGAGGFWWRWYEGPIETTAFALQALVTVDPNHRLVEPAMNWLVKNRRGAQWSNTRDTAIVLLAMNDYLQKSGELAGNVAYEVSVNGKVLATKKLSAADVVGAPSRFAVDPSMLAAGAQEIVIRRTAGTAPLYFSAEARFVSLEEPVKAAGNEIFVRREYFRLAPRPTLLKGVLYDRVPLRDQEKIASGERVEVVVTIDAKNDYSYLLFEDLKPAGFEAVELQSGQALYATQPKTGKTAWIYQELRDRKVAMFADHLGQGLWEIRYTLRAEVPGSFHALPLMGEAMYVPDIRANSDEVRVVVTE